MERSRERRFDASVRTDSPHRGAHTSCSRIYPGMIGSGAAIARPHLGMPHTITLAGRRQTAARAIS
jgi:hypothetical protein